MTPSSARLPETTHIIWFGPWGWGEGLNKRCRNRPKVLIQLLLELQGTKIRESCNLLKDGSYLKSQSNIASY